MHNQRELQNPKVSITFGVLHSSETFHDGGYVKKLDEENKLLFDFIEEDQGEQQAEKKNSRCCCWVGTWNNPKMSDDEFYDFLIRLENEDRIKYATFQREKGEESGIEHFQFFVNFKTALRFTRVKEILPYGCHFKPMISTAERCRDYCQKADTRISKSYYEVGEFVSERQRTDLDKAIKMIDEGFSLQDVEETFPKQFFIYSRQFNSRFWNRLNRIFGDCDRNIETVFLWGDPGSGKTTYVNKQVEHRRDLFRVDNYGDYWFTGYAGQDVILLDEFVGQIDIPRMNKLLDPQPQQMNTKGGQVPACFSKVFIVSNLPLKELYQKTQMENKVLFNAFCRRLNKILHFYNDGRVVVERETFWTELEDKYAYGGVKRVPEKVVEYNMGVPKIIYQRGKFVQTELTELDVGGLPW